jgi:hypothetical protein
MDGELDGVLSWREQSQRGVSIGFTFLPHVIIPDKRNGVHWTEYNSCHRDARAI